MDVQVLNLKQPLFRLSSFEVFVLAGNRKNQESSTTVNKSKAKLHLANKVNASQLNEQPLFCTNPEAVMPLLSMSGQPPQNSFDIELYQPYAV